MHFPSSHRTATPLKHFVVAALLALSVVGSLVVPVVVNVTHALGSDNTATPGSVGANVNASASKAEDPECGIMNLKGCVAVAAWGVMRMFGVFTNLGNLALNYTTQTMVVGMGLMLGPDGSMSNGVNTAWRTLRDLMNVGLVFLTIFIGIAIILGVSEYGSKHLLWKVVLAAILINFSITLTKFVIDVGNIVTVATYKQILSTSPSHGSAGADPGNCTRIELTIPDECMNKGISAVIMQEMKLTTIYNSINGTADIAKIIWVALLGSIFFIIAGFVFFTAAYLILTRFVILVFLIIVSPVGMVAWITGLHHLGRKWWEMLLNQSFFLPIMFVLWLASINVITGMNKARQGHSTDNLAASLSLPGDSALASAPQNFASVMEVIVFFAVISGLLIVSMIVAKDMGAYGAKAAVDKGKSWSKKVGMKVGTKTGGATLGVSAWALRRGVGGAADKFANSNALKNQVASNSFIRKNLARGVQRASKNVAGRSFDARALLDKDAQNWVGKGEKGGYTQWRKDRDKKIDEEHKWVKEEKPTSQERAERDKAVKKTGQEFDQIRNTNTKAQILVKELGLKEDIRTLEEKIKSETNPERRTKLEKQIDEKKAEASLVNEHKNNVERQAKLREELRTGTITDQNGKASNLSPEARKQKEKELESVTQNVHSGYALVDDNVKALEGGITAGKKQLETLSGSEAAAMKEQIADLEKQRNTVIKYHEANRDFMDSGSDEAKNALAAAEADLAKVESAKIRKIDLALKDKVSARGKARAEQYINNTSSERRLFGLLKSSAGDYEKLMKLREEGGKKKLTKDLEKFIEEAIKDEKKVSDTEAPK